MAGTGPSIVPAFLLATLLTAAACSGSRDESSRTTKVTILDAAATRQDAADPIEEVAQGDSAGAPGADAAVPAASPGDAGAAGASEAQVAANDAALDASPAPDAASAAQDAGPLDASTANDAGALFASLFLSHPLNNRIYRYAIAPGVDPILHATISADAPAGMAMSAKGELFAASEDGRILRFATPLAAPLANGVLEGLGVSSPEELAFVDDELWIPSTVYTSCTTDASKITRVAFDTAGAGRVAGVVQAAGIITAARGLVWDVTRRLLFLSSCHAVNTLQPYRVAEDHSVVELVAATGGELANPHGMAIAPWGELFVSSADSQRIARFFIDAQGGLRANGFISGSGDLSFPIGLAFAPWGELFVVNQGTGSLARFSFAHEDSGYEVHARSSYSTGLDSSPATHRLGWILIAAGPGTLAP